MGGVSSSSCLLEINLVNLNLPINEFINIDHDTKAINVHEDKAWVDIIGDAAIGAAGRPGVYNNTPFVLVGSELMGMTCDKDIYIQLPLKHG